MKSNFLTIKNLTKIYDVGSPSEVVALNNFSFSIKKGDFVTIVGSNAAGKTTLFNLINGSDSPTSGEILLEGEPLSELPEFKRAKLISCVRQNPNDSVIVSMTLAENLSLAKINGRSANLDKGVKKEWKKEFKKILKSFGLGLEKRLDDKVSSFSGGQKQIAALLMATISKPKLLLLDEHTAALDPNVSKMVLRITDQIVKEEKVTTLMITHNIRQAIEHGNLLILLEKGRIGFKVGDSQKRSLNIIEIENLLENGLAKFGKF